MNTVATMHIEDAGLWSVNLVVCGAPKLWLVIPPAQKKKLEAALCREYESPPTCSQKIRHFNVLISPAKLRDWGITYHVKACHAGELIFTTPDNYHQVINPGSCLAQSVNFEIPSSEAMPNGYIWCSPAHCSNYVAVSTITADLFRLRDDVAQEHNNLGARDVTSSFLRTALPTCHSKRNKPTSKSQIFKKRRIDDDDDEEDENEDEDGEEDENDDENGDEENENEGEDGGEEDENEKENGDEEDKNKDEAGRERIVQKALSTSLSSYLLGAVLGKKALKRALSVIKGWETEHTNAKKPQESICVRVRDAAATENNIDRIVAWIAVEGVCGKKKALYCFLHLVALSWLAREVDKLKKGRIRQESVKEAMERMGEGAFKRTFSRKIINGRRLNGGLGEYRGLFFLLPPKPQKPYNVSIKDYGNMKKEEMEEFKAKFADNSRARELERMGRSFEKNVVKGWGSTDKLVMRLETILKEVDK